MKERPYSDVPTSLLALAFIGFVTQIVVHFSTPKATASAEQLTDPPSLAWLQATSMGEPISRAKWLMLSLQAFDNQPGISIPFLELDYDKIIHWLDVILALDPHGQYPLLSASRLYAEVPNAAKQRQMLEFVHQKFLEDPNRRWPWLAHASVVARHRLGDLHLARTYAASLREHATGDEVPHWVSQMDAMLAADMNEVDTARVLLGGLLSSGQITDAHELNFLRGRLEALEKQTPTK